MKGTQGPKMSSAEYTQGIWQLLEPLSFPQGQKPDTQVSYLAAPGAFLSSPSPSAPPPHHQLLQMTII